eukprot:TRINITY_DN6736_c0_g1_i1.p1 TRINITY_DN6736_c0_g1~~TRINITY_DN6736_c0_g1_i1.p1  ORF type:complete len:326 (+),score=53.48 TRINITY_DN6736_c0_g1_i1:53-979(+)
MDAQQTHAALDDAICFVACIASTVVIPGKLREEHGKSLQALAGVVGLLVAGYRNHNELFWTCANPWEMTAMQWAIGYLAKVISIRVMDKGIMKATEVLYANRRLKYRVEHNIQNSDHTLEWIDYTYLGLNSFVETGFLMHLSYFVWHDKTLSWNIMGLTFYNTIPALWALLFVNDMLYAPLHLLMHVKVLYPYVHKHHHRSFLPSRYYTDAGNDHPIEQVGGLLCMWAAMLFSLHSTGLHIATLVCFFTAYLLVQICNHSPFDVRMNLLGISYEAGLHEMHHRIPSCNMAQYCMTFDKIVDTYRPYSY